MDSKPEHIRRYLAQCNHNGNPFQQALIGVMNKYNLSQSDVGRAANCRQNQISNYVSGKTIPALNVASRIMTALFTSTETIETIKQMVKYRPSIGAPTCRN